MKKNQLIVLLALVSLSITSCKKNSKIVQGEFENGIFVVNEGQFGQGNASMSFISEDFTSVKNGIYHTSTNLDLGDQAQSIGFSDANAYIVVSGSNKIEVADKNTMEKQVTIASDLVTPRYFQAVNNHTAYVTCWGDAANNTDDYIAVINTDNNTVTRRIPVELGPEKMLQSANYLFIAHKGAWGTNNKITVYDLIVNQLKSVLTVGDRPNSMAIKDDFLYVLCSGEPSWAGTETAGQLYKIDINNNFAIVNTLNFATTEHPDFLSIDGDNLYYYLNGKVYKMNVADTSLPTSEFISYPTAYNMETYNGKLYITDAKNYTQEGELIQYNLSNGQETGRKTVGIIPGDIGFNF